MSILWAVDLGNSRVKMGRFVGGALAEAHAYADPEAGLAFLLGEGDADGYALLATGPGEERWRRALGAAAWSYRPGAPCPLVLDYETPATLGADRLAAAVGARAICPGTDCLVVDAGTCITYEYVGYADPGAGARYRGGNISPGLRMRLRAMHEFTGKLPLVDLRLPPDPVGRSTAAALQNGALRGAAAEISAAVAAFRRDYPAGATLVCGGDSALLRALLPADVLHRPHLVLEGLAELYAYAHAD